MYPFFSVKSVIFMTNFFPSLYFLLCKESSSGLNNWPFLSVNKMFSQLSVFFRVHFGDQFYLNFTLFTSKLNSSGYYFVTILYQFIILSLVTKIFAILLTVYSITLILKFNHLHPCSVRLTLIKTVYEL